MNHQELNIRVSMQSKRDRNPIKTCRVTSHLFYLIVSLLKFLFLF